MRKTARAPGTTAAAHDPRGPSSHDWTRIDQGGPSGPECEQQAALARIARIACTRSQADLPASVGRTSFYLRLCPPHHEDVVWLKGRCVTGRGSSESSLELFSPRSSNATFSPLSRGLRAKAVVQAPSEGCNRLPAPRVGLAIKVRPVELTVHSLSETPHFALCQWHCIGPNEGASA